MVEAIIALRIERRSCSARRGESNIDWKTVGGPNSNVICSSSIVAIARSVSNIGSGRIVAPCTMQAIQPALYPKV